MKVWKIATVILALIIVIGGGFWGYTVVKGNNDAKMSAELNALQSALIQKHGINIQIKQVVSPTKVFVVAWQYSGDNTTYVDWSIGGVVATVLTIPPPSASTP